MNACANATSLRFEELDALDAPSWESFYQGMLAGLGVVGVAVIAT
ncbi:MAG: MpaA1 family daptide-type RiPP [Actinomycetota bacterium]